MKKVYLIAVIFAIIAGFATFMFAKNLDAKTTIKDADTKVVYVALQDIAENTQIVESMFAEDAGYFTLKEVVAADADPNSITAEERDDLLLNKITADAIYAGEQISSARLLDEDADNVSLSFKLSPGMVAYSIAASNVSGVDGYIGTGDTVDIIVYDGATGEASLEYEELPVIRVSNNSDNAAASSSGNAITAYSAITVEVTPDEALRLREIESQDYKLILNSRAAE